MKKYLYFLFYGICLALVCQACDSDDEIIFPVYPLNKFVVISADGKEYHAYINQQTHDIEISGVKYSSSIVAVNYQLTEGATIFPDPNSLLSDWPANIKFIVTVGNNITEYTFTLKNWEEEPETDLTPDPNKWQLAWEENFDKPEIDWTVWSKIPRNKSDWNNTMASYDELFELNDGILTLWGVQNTNHPEDPSAYLTGGLWGLDKKAFTMGRIDIRAKFDSAQGFWPALWLLPQDGDAPNSGYGELDIVEHLNFDPYVHMTLHSEYTNLVDKVNTPNAVQAPFNEGEFNIYGVEVHEDKVVYWVNNKEVYSYPRLYPEIPGQFPFYGQKQFYVILSAQLGGQWVGSVTAAHLPAGLYVDWVKCYDAIENE